MAPLSHARLGGALGTLSAGIGLLHLAGWGAGWSLLISPPPGFIPQAPNTALAFLLLGSALAWSAIARVPAALRTLRVASMAVAVLAAATLADAGLGSPWGVDQWVIPVSGRLGRFPLGAMSPVTAGGLLAVACATGVLAGASLTPRRATSAATFGLLAAALGAIVVLGYLYGAPLLYGTGTIPVALATGFAFLFLGAGTTAAAGQAAWPVSTFLGPAPRARLLRAFLPPIALMIVAVQLVEARLLASNPGQRALVSAYLLIAAVVLLALIVAPTAARLGHILANASSARAAAEARAETLSRQNALLLEAAAEGVIALDADGRITFANPAAGRMLDWEPAALEGRPFHVTLQHSRADGSPFPTEASSVLTALRGAHAGGVARASFCLRGGGTIPVEFRASPLTGAAGLVVTFNDARERIALEQQFLQAQKMEALGRIAGGAAHDFNNVLMALRASTLLALDSLGADHPARVEVEEIRAGVDRAVELTRRLLSFSRRPAEGDAAADLAAAVRGVDTLLRRVLGKGVALTIEAPADALPVRIGLNALEQIIVNLAVNARDAMPNGGALTLVAAREGTAELGPCAVLVVRDTGTGMEEATRLRVFEPFFTTKPPDVGTGLGLAMVYGAVTQAGGRVDVQSAPGAGTTIRLVLPLVGAAARGATILVVEDEVKVRSAILRILERAGFRALAAGDGEEAIRTAEAFPGVIDVVLTDTFLPRMPIEQVAERIAAVRPEARLIRMSGYPAEMREQLGIASAGMPFLAKPFTIEELLQVVREAVDRPPPTRAPEAS